MVREPAAHPVSRSPSEGEPQPLLRKRHHTHICLPLAHIQRERHSRLQSPRLHLIMKKQHTHPRPAKERMFHRCRAPLRPPPRQTPQSPWFSRERETIPPPCNPLVASFHQPHDPGHAAHRPERPRPPDSSREIDHGVRAAKHLTFPRHEPHFARDPWQRGKLDTLFRQQSLAASRPSRAECAPGIVEDACAFLVSYFCNYRIHNAKKSQPSNAPTFEPIFISFRNVAGGSFPTSA